MIKVTQEKNRTVCSIEGEMTIYQAVDMRNALVKELETDGEVDVELSQVSEIDSAGLQLLLAIKSEAKESGRSVNYVNHSPAVVDIIQLYGLDEYFGDQVLLPSEERAAS